MDAPGFWGNIVRLLYEGLTSFASPEISARDVECLEGRGYPEPVVRSGMGAVLAL